MKLTPFAKLFIAAVVVTATAFILLATGMSKRIFTRPNQVAAVVPKIVGYPSAPGCLDKPAIRIYLPAWNATAPLILANGGQVSTADSLICGQHKLRVELVRDDNAANTYAYTAAHAADPDKGGPIFIAMGDGGALHATKTNELLGSGRKVKIIAFSGFSNGEDKVVVPPEMKKDPQKLRGAYIAVVPGDGDHLLLLQFLAMANIPVSHDYQGYDPDSVNIYAATTYTGAAEAFATKACENLYNIKTEQDERRCVDGVSTWTPGDVTAVTKRGGVVELVSTADFPRQMPATFFVDGAWAADHEREVASILAATFEAAQRILDEEHQLNKAMALSAQVYQEQDAAYWLRYYKGADHVDAQGNRVRLGGSRVATYGEVREMLANGAYADIYNGFGRMLQQVIPKDLPRFDPANEVVELRYLDLAKKMLEDRKVLTDYKPATPASTGIRRVLASRSWDIRFDTGRSSLLPESAEMVAEICLQARIASDTILEIEGHTDDRGSADGNLRLSVSRAQAVKDTLVRCDPGIEKRVRVHGYGMSRPVASNQSEEGRGKNRRVVVTFGYSS